MDIQASKAELRKLAETHRAALSAEERAERSALACRAAIGLLEERFAAHREAAFSMFGYVPFRTELNVTPLMDWCWQRGGNVIVPRVARGGEKKMTLHTIRCVSELEAGRWGIREPAADAPSWPLTARIDVVIVPGLAFDAGGGRLGYGGGYYDGFMRAYKERTGIDPYKLALAFDVQIVAEVPMDGFDLRADAVVTESRKWIVPTDQ
ncbi:MAG: 5-formyltetrahydrofolate cyclo-ligase family protein [Paenibacillus sp.]|jgi:5-formyltetrahydrofolate cyclo-ligase|nr:5-formyltetrahydrofolate cyclo-ligase family protein [Paenibacillus sp.]